MIRGRKPAQRCQLGDVARWRTFRAKRNPNQTQIFDSTAARDITKMETSSTRSGAGPVFETSFGGGGMDVSCACVCVCACARDVGLC